MISIYKNMNRRLLNVVYNNMGKINMNLNRMLSK